MEIGEAVQVVDEVRDQHIGLVTAVHGPRNVPLVNVVYLSSDVSKRDPYGRQVERLSSLQHYSNGPNKMDVPGRYWVGLSEEV